VKICKQNGVKPFLHTDVDLAQRLQADGVHLTSTQFEKILHAKELGLEVIISTHTYDEVLKAQSLGADYVTYSPIFTTPDKGEPKGVDDLKVLLNKCTVKVFALGGIVEEQHVETVEKSGVFGFASIRYFESH
jgi:thiamine-phosphate pyrophosphorylase